MGYSEEDEEEKFVNKIRTLKHVAIDLTALIQNQTQSLRDLEPGFSGTLHKLQGSVRRLHKMDPRRFRAWLFYIVASLFFTILLLIFNFIF